ncbi:MAG: hypothetical protein HY670_12445 [Chloroflexi bacterium]|nr:hypothetical protein [Chloroflexota bacterium]
MALNMRSFRVEDACFGKKTAFANGVLTINRKDLQTLLAADAGTVESVGVALAKPGENTRIIHILDAIEPRAKTASEITAFPGFLGPPLQAGSGVTSRLEGMAVLTCGEFPEWGADLQMGANEAIVDMAGPGASLSPFSQTINLALVFKRRQGATAIEFADAIRIAGFKAATYLADAVKDRTPSSEQVFSLETRRGVRALPRVGIVYLLSSLDAPALPLRESFFYGYPVGGLFPTILHPNELLDGAVVCNYCTWGGMRNPTYFFQNNGALYELYRQHGKELTFVGTIVSRAGDTSDTGKLNRAARAAALGKFMKFDGAIVLANAGGHHIVDFMLMCQHLEKSDIKAVGVVAEMANVDGTDNGFPFFVPEARSLVSTGNVEETVELPPVANVIGGDRLSYGYEAGARLKLAVWQVLCSNSQSGDWNIGAKSF